MIYIPPMLVFEAVVFQAVVKLLEVVEAVSHHLLLGRGESDRHQGESQCEIQFRSLAWMRLAWMNLIAILLGSF